MRLPKIAFLTSLCFLLGFPAKFAGAEKIYWTDFANHKIQRANLDGSDIEDLVTSDIFKPYGIALDLTNAKMYWTESWQDPNNKIKRANLDGTDVEILVTESEIPNGGGAHYLNHIALDVDGGWMYYVAGGSPNNPTDMVQRATLDGTSIEILVTGLDGPRGIALDLTSGKMYWTREADSRIQRANLDGSAVETLITNVGGLNGIAVDVAGGKVYWTDHHPFHDIRSANLDGSNVVPLVPELENPMGIALDTIGGRMYWADATTGTIHRAGLDGTEMETLIADLGGPLGVAVDLSLDCNDNGFPDSFDISQGSSNDNNSNGIPDECECPADFDFNGAVGAFDLAVLLGSWGPCPEPPASCPADIHGDGDGIVQADDLATLLGSWGPCP